MLRCMNTSSTQPFGRRGLSQTAAARPQSFTPSAAPASPNVAISPELIAHLVSKGDKEKHARRGPDPVRWSYLAALLSGFIVAILNAAANASFAATARDGLGFVSFGSADGPIIAALLITALWKGARTSALCLIVVHRLLAWMGRTSYASYIIGGGATSLAFALLIEAFGYGPGAGGLGLEALSGMGAGLFYRLFAGTKPQDP